MKPVKKFVCQDCGYTSRQEIFECPQCHNYNVEEVAVVDSTAKKSGIKTSAEKATSTPHSLSKVSRTVQRCATNIAELDRVLGGGFVASEVVLLGGSPGAGKSTLSLSIADSFAQQNKRVLYMSGEESPEQIGLRADRMNVSSDNIVVVHTSSLEDMLWHIENEEPDLFIVDSLQTVASGELKGSLGSIQQSKEAAHALNSAAKERGVNAILVNQVNKNDDFAGSVAIQHVVDASLFFESDRDSPLKFLRAYKNRFGGTDEVGLFQHTETGIEGVSDPAGILMESSQDALAGVSYGVMTEGVRQIPVEIQSLVTTSNFSNPQRKFNGIDYNRGQIIVAIVSKYCHHTIDDMDVFAATVFGASVNQPLCDLAIAVSIVSSLTDTAVTTRTMFVGELSLSGQVRGSYNVSRAVDEAQRMGFDRIVLPTSARASVSSAPRNVKIDYIDHIKNISQFIK